MFAGRLFASCQRSAELPTLSWGAHCSPNCADRCVSCVQETFCWMPLAFVLNSRVMVVHGGLFSKDDVTLVRGKGRSGFGKSVHC